VHHAGDVSLPACLPSVRYTVGLDLDDADFTDAQAVATIVRITGGNFRLLHRLFVQIERILRINGLNSITDEMVEAACSVLVIGAT
jgi:hypothetical protein